MWLWLVGNAPIRLNFVSISNSVFCAKLLCSAYTGADPAGLYRYHIDFRVFSVCELTGLLDSKMDHVVVAEERFIKLY